LLLLLLLPLWMHQLVQHDINININININKKLRQLRASSQYCKQFEIYSTASASPYPSSLPGSIAKAGGGVVMVAARASSLGCCCCCLFHGCI
jgi:hypothetical protein